MNKSLTKKEMEEAIFLLSKNQLDLATALNEFLKGYRATVDLGIKNAELSKELADAFIKLRKQLYDQINKKGE